MSRSSWICSSEVETSLALTMKLSLGRKVVLALTWEMGGMCSNILSRLRRYLRFFVELSTLRVSFVNTISVSVKWYPNNQWWSEIVLGRIFWLLARPVRNTIASVSPISYSRSEILKIRLISPFTKSHTILKVARKIDQGALLDSRTFIQNYYSQPFVNFSLLRKKIKNTHNFHPRGIPPVYWLPAFLLTFLALLINYYKFFSSTLIGKMED